MPKTVIPVLPLPELLLDSGLALQVTLAGRGLGGGAAGGPRVRVSTITAYRSSTRQGTKESSVR